MTVTPWPLSDRLRHAERSCLSLRLMLSAGLTFSYYAPMLAEQERRAAALRAAILRLQGGN